MGTNFTFNNILIWFTNSIRFYYYSGTKTIFGYWIKDQLNSQLNYDSMCYNTFTAEELRINKNLNKFRFMKCKQFNLDFQLWIPKMSLSWLNININTMDIFAFFITKTILFCKY